MSDARQPHLVFASGSSWYAVPAETASEVVSVPELTRVPGAPAHLLGVFAHRGEVIPVIDLPSLIGGASNETRRAVLLRLGQGALALTASRVAGVSPLSSTLDPLGKAGVHLHLRGPAQAQGREIAVIEPEGLFDFLSQGSAA
jgi:purine-binding chemotaxis protein CheW